MVGHCSHVSSPSAQLSFAFSLSLAAADKLVHYLLLLRDNFERYEDFASQVPEKQLLTREVGGEIRMRRPTLWHFATLVSDLFERKAKRFVSMDDLTPIIRHIQLCCIRASHINILEEFSQLRREKGLDTVKARLQDLMAAFDSAVFLFKLAALDSKERDVSTELNFRISSDRY